MLVDAKVNYSEIEKSEIYFAGLNEFFKVDFDFDRHIDVQFGKSFYGNSVRLQGTVGWDGSLDLTGEAKTNLDTSFRGVGVDVTKTFIVNVYTNVSGEASLSIYTRLWMDGRQF